MLDHRCVSPCLGMRNILEGKNNKGKDLETAAHEWKVEGYGIMESRGHVMVRQEEPGYGGTM